MRSGPDSPHDDPPHNPGRARTDLHIDQRAKSISEWWLATANADVKEIAAKVREYDGLDLEIMGTAMQAFLPDGLDPATSRSAGLEMACTFYALGKLARAFGAFRQGRIPSADTPYDLQVYAGMIRYIREHGTW